MRTVARLLALLLLAGRAFAQQPAPEAAASPAPPVAPQARITYSSAHVDGPYIALTFDDGPHPRLTPKLLALLAERHIKVTFFLIGENVKAHPEIAKAEADAGHVIGNHSYTHPDLKKLSEININDQLQRTDDAIKAAIGHSPALMRPPYGALSPLQRIVVHRKFGYTIILWDVDPNDWKDPGPAVVASRILAEVRPGSIILSHDIHAGTVEAMPYIIDTLLKRGYKFVTVPELIAMDKPRAPKSGTGTTAAPAPAPAAVPATTPGAPAAAPSPSP